MPRRSSQARPGPRTSRSSTSSQVAQRATTPGAWSKTRTPAIAPVHPQVPQPATVAVTSGRKTSWSGPVSALPSVHSGGPVIAAPSGAVRSESFGLDPFWRVPPVGQQVGDGLHEPGRAAHKQTPTRLPVPPSTRAKQLALLWPAGQPLIVSCRLIPARPSGYLGGVAALPARRVP